MSVAIITGASSGIGREFARQLKEIPGVDEFWFVARRTDRLEALAEELSVKAKIIGADLATMEGVNRVREALKEENPRVRFLVNAAGFGKFGSFDQVPEEEIVRMMDLNDKALVLITHMTIPYMEEGGRIIEM
ncbi:MAG TPA: short-chain dehydrogenase, partial [Clostridiales bacterium]|nr:short-chain dehydrogenase [Clostridiales bacterium]